MGSGEGVREFEVSRFMEGEATRFFLELELRGDFFNDFLADFLAERFATFLVEPFAMLGLRRTNKRISEQSSDHE